MPWFSLLDTTVMVDVLSWALMVSKYSLSLPVPEPIVEDVPPIIYFSPTAGRVEFEIVEPVYRSPPVEWSAFWFIWRTTEAPE